MDGRGGAAPNRGRGWRRHRPPLGQQGAQPARPGQPDDENGPPPQNVQRQQRERDRRRHPGGGQHNDGPGGGRGLLGPRPGAMGEHRQGARLPPRPQRQLQQQQQQLHPQLGANQDGGARPGAGEPNGAARRGGPRAAAPLGYKRLEGLAQDDGIAIMQKLADEATLAEFVKLTREKTLTEDWIRLIVAILAKVCVVEYREIVLTLFHPICQREFLEKLLLHIVQLGSDSNEKRRATVGEFFRNFCTVAQGIIKYIPDVACERLENLVKKASREVQDLAPFDGSEGLRGEFDAILVKIAAEKERLANARTAREAAGPQQQQQQQPAAGGRRQLRLFSVGPPPENFRDLSVSPTVDDLLPYRPYLRPNVVQGPYLNVEHYLDVHYRLLKEDFVRPLREGIREYEQKLLELESAPKKNKKTRIRVNNVRIYEKVKLVSVVPDGERIAVELCFDPEETFAAKMNWEYSKRLMNGCLLVLSRDNAFTSVTLVTVAKRDPKKLLKGTVLVEMCEGHVIRENLFTGHFLMVECQVFFGAYSPVLKALKTYDEDSFPLKEYLVYGSGEEHLPTYQQRALENDRAAAWFHLPLRSDSAVGSERTVPLRVDDVEGWPDAARLGLDRSQYRALRGAITNKLMLIQGPPGTGKTFLGLKIAASLLHNKELWNSGRRPRPMLIVCYTNHALDQFLSGLLPATESIVRVGGGCKEPRLEQCAINNLRRTCRPPGQRELYMRIRERRERFAKVKNICDGLRSCVQSLKDGAGIVDADTLYNFGIISQNQLHFFNRTPIVRWLGLEGNVHYVERVSGRKCTEAILRPDEWDLACVPNAETVHDVLSASFEVSCNVLVGIKSEREEKGDRESTAVINVLLTSVRGGLLGTHIPELPDIMDARIVNVGRLVNVWQRWQIYRLWVRLLLGIRLEPALNEVDNEYAAAANELQEWRMMEDQAIMANHLVIGMTTSYAAAKQKILKELKPSIVIIEEAAEVLEAHVLVSLTGDVEHLIMIGDHQQLRPNPAVYDLARNYHLDVSLFERLINNGVHCETLSTQHRMRAEIARLICPAIYPNLLNHESVSRFPDVRGVTKNVFFVDHAHPEQKVDDAQSFQNSHEADFISSLVRFLWLQGYDGSKITVLSTYKGQQYYFSKLRREEAHLKDVRITVVDNYQGEECDIILLSLVRSNQEDAVGFLKTENRVCVALSRARHGFFMVGNMANMTAADTVWRKVRAELEAQGSFGPALTLRCETHGTLTAVGSAADFAQCPQGGCNKLCGVLMPCGHHCVQVCHIQDREHRDARCTQPCQKEICPERHLCPDRCFEKCQPCKVPKIERLLCGHEVKMACHRDPLTVKCKTWVSVRLPDCNHEQEVHCYQTAHLETVACREPCIVRMDCGHVCEKSCHVRDDPQHKQVKCMKKCGQKKDGCRMDHTCRKMCHEPCEECDVLMEKTLPQCKHKLKMKCREDPADRECGRKCSRKAPCGVHDCLKLCRVPCGPCTAKVAKVIPQCGHTQEMECSMNPMQFTGCSGPCKRRLVRCGHLCKLKCGESCSDAECLEPVPYRTKAACGHNVMIPCYKNGAYAPSSSALLILCKEPCPKVLECEHRCAGTCGTCLQGRFHVRCRSKCEKPLICGHACKEFCAVSCPPCNQVCPVKCAHSVCGKRCGEPCTPCTERCQRRCVHKTCPRPCGDLCPDDACDEPCPKKVDPCGHDCVGLCGDICICKECNDGEFDIFFGDEDEEGARFVFLPDCRHIVESNGLDTWMLGKDDEITQKECPKCKTRVTTSLRYSNIIKRNARDVTKVKQKVFGDWLVIKPAARRAREILEAVHPFPRECTVTADLVKKVDSSLKEVEERFPDSAGKQRGARKRPVRSLTEITSLEQYAGILRSLSSICREFLGDSKTTQRPKVNPAGRTELLRFVDDLCSNIYSPNIFRLTQQEAIDVNLELKRLQRLVQLCQVESGPNFPSLTSADKDIYRRASEVIRAVGPYAKKHDALVSSALESLARKVDVSITRQEIDAVVAALGMQQGHWFQCRNGHPYVITECGGAMQESTCNECGAPIGGRNHQLRGDNQLATQIDRAARPAYPTFGPDDYDLNGLI